MTPRTSILILAFSIQEDYLNKLVILNMKVVKYFIAICIPITFFSCAKEAVITNTDFQKNLLAGTGNYQNTSNVWRLDSLTISGAPYQLSAIEKRYTKTMFRDGSYMDSDGYAGVWEMIADNKLDITTTNSVTNVKTKNSYDIITLNAAQLHIKITGAKGAYQYFFVIAN
jgi:hypothetical protein